MNEPFVWRGRVDSEEIGDSRRWHQHVEPIGTAAPGADPPGTAPPRTTSPGTTSPRTPPPATAASATMPSGGPAPDALAAAPGVTLIGFAVDEGVRRNAGRTGASSGPTALRGALANLPLLDEPAIRDAGDIGCDDGDLDAAQQALAATVAAAIEAGDLPIVLGGGHEVAWGTFQGIVAARPGLRRILVVNFDAHFDLRVASQATSGTPFRQIAEWSAANGRPFDYHVLGISRYANTRALFDRADALGVRHVLDEDLQADAGVQAAADALARDVAASEAVYLTVCLDVLPGGQAPGVSAPAPLGVPLATVLALMRPVLASGKVIAADIAELNPAFDRDGLTARVAARIAATIAREARR